MLSERKKTNLYWQLNLALIQAQSPNSVPIPVRLIFTHSEEFVNFLIL